MPRVVRHHPSYVAFGTVSLALAVGATVAVFTVVNALWLRALPYPEPDRLVTLVYDVATDLDPAFFGIQTRYSARWTAFEFVAGQVVSSGSTGGFAPHVVVPPACGQCQSKGDAAQAACRRIPAATGCDVGGAGVTGIEPAQRAIHRVTAIRGRAVAGGTRCVARRTLHGAAQGVGSHASIPRVRCGPQRHSRMAPSLP